MVPSQFLANNGIHPPYASPANHVGVQGARPFKCFREAGCFTHTFKGRVGSERPRDCGTHLLRYHLRLRLGLAFVFGSQGFGDGDAYTVCVPMCHDNLKGGTNRGRSSKGFRKFSFAFAAWQRSQIAQQQSGRQALLCPSSTGPKLRGK